MIALQVRYKLIGEKWRTVEIIGCTRYNKPKPVLSCTTAGDGWDLLEFHDDDTVTLNGDRIGTLECKEMLTIEAFRHVDQDGRVNV